MTYVPMDFDEQDLEDELAAAGFRTGARSFFIWEGVTQYITSEAVDDTFRFVARASAPGSAIAFTYVRKDIIDGSARTSADELVVKAVQRAGAPWPTGLNPSELEGYLAERGLSLIDHAGPPEYRDRYLRPAGRDMTICPGENIALAEAAPAGGDETDG